MFFLDRNTKIDNTLSANELAQSFDWYWKFYGLEIPWLGGVQVLQRGIVEPHEQHRTAFCHRVMTIGSLELGGSNALASISCKIIKSLTPLFFGTSNIFEGFAMIGEYHFCVGNQITFHQLGVLTV